MPTEPGVKRTIAFFDGQNLFHAARDAFGYTYPNYDPVALARRVCQDQGWRLDQTRFYTGVPDATSNPKWDHFWNKKLLRLSRLAGVHVYSRALRKKTRKIDLPDGSIFSFDTSEEKGIDVRIAIDVIRLGHRNEYDVALLFSQDQDLSEAAAEIRVIAHEQGRWIKIASAFPDSPKCRNHRGINRTDWIAIERSTYDACLDPRNYFPP